ncbi:DCAF13, partial [Cordylochernes scorpioides]
VDPLLTQCVMPTEYRNYDPALHPLAEARNYTSALNAAKMERMFAKPFLANLNGHTDSVSCMAKHPTQVEYVYSGGYDGLIKVWNLAERNCVKTYSCTENRIEGLTTSHTAPGQPYLYSVGSDMTLRQWSLDPTGPNKATNTVVWERTMVGVDHSWHEPLLATCGQAVDVWVPGHSQPSHTYKWGNDTQHCVRFNPIEPNILATTASDRSITLYDTRSKEGIRKIVMAMRSNELSWNPMEAYIFTVANEDYKLYSYDLRKLDVALHVYMDHISAVMSVDYAPTGKEFISGSYDKTIRIYRTNHGHSREVYHTKRMQRVSNVIWTLDNKYVLSSSDEFNIRLWKARAHEKLGEKYCVIPPSAVMYGLYCAQVSYREKISLDQREKLKEKYKYFPEVSRILRHRHIPQHIYNGASENRTMLQSRKRKEANRRAHSKAGTMPYICLHASLSQQCPLSWVIALHWKMAAVRMLFILEMDQNLGRIFNGSTGRFSWTSPPIRCYTSQISTSTL